VLCELDWIKVKGKDEAFSIFQLIDEEVSAEPVEMRYRERYRAGLECYRAGDFATAEDIWRQQATGSIALSSAALIMARRCSDLKSAPPAVWDGVFVKTSK
jgi:hypothetical protein